MGDVKEMWLLTSTLLFGSRSDSHFQRSSAARKMPFQDQRKDISGGYCSFLVLLVGELFKSLKWFFLKFY